MQADLLNLMSRFDRDDETDRLVLADLLEEHGRLTEASLMRGPYHQYLIWATPKGQFIIRPRVRVIMPGSYRPRLGAAREFVDAYSAWTWLNDERVRVTDCWMVLTPSRCGGSPSELLSGGDFRAWVLSPD
jgi:uncharacterized protein (TIGR02996 family)